VSNTATQLGTLAAALTDPDSDLAQIADLEDELVAARDTGLIPRPQEHRAGALDAGNSYGRHVLCNILAGAVQDSDDGVRSVTVGTTGTLPGIRGPRSARAALRWACSRCAASERESGHS
jgi:hypothetical protein